MKHFKDFVDQKTRQSRHELTLLRRVLESQGLDAVALLDEQGEDDEPYIFVKATEDLSFDGVRIYKVGDQIAYRVQKEKDTQPYGRAYSLEIEEMYNDLLADNMDEKKAGQKIMEAVAGELKKFFEKSKRAERDMQNGKLDQKYSIKQTLDFGISASHMNY